MAAKNAESKFLGKVANPKLKATGKAALKATGGNYAANTSSNTGRATSTSSHNTYNNSNNGYNSGPRLGSTREDRGGSYSPENTNEFTIRH